MLLWAAVEVVAWKELYGHVFGLFQGETSLELTDAAVSVLTAYQKRRCTGKMRIRVVARVGHSALARPGESLFLQISG